MGIWLGGLVIGMLGMSYAFVPLYRMFCQTTGYAGATRPVVQGEMWVELRADLISS